MEPSSTENNAITGAEEPVALQVKATELWWVTVALNISLCLLDEKKIKAAGYNTSKFGKLWLFLVPVYLFRRAKYLKQKPTYAWVWVVVFILSTLGS